MQKLSMKLITAALLTAGVAACSDVSGPSNQSAVGTYYLQTVNGNRLPYTFGQNGSNVSIQADTYTLNNDYSYTETTDETVYDGFQNSNVRHSEYGSWSQNNNAISFSPSTGGSYAPYTGSLSGGGNLLGGGADLTIAVNGTVSVYTAQ
ncbi:MAG: hypothetical protein ACR2MQ_06565 [Gemmatimonadaceae bacterium]